VGQVGTKCNQFLQTFYPPWPPPRHWQPCLSLGLHGSYLAAQALGSTQAWHPVCAHSKGLYPLYLVPEALISWQSYCQSGTLIPSSVREPQGWQELLAWWLRQGTLASWGTVMSQGEQFHCFTPTVCSLGLARDPLGGGRGMLEGHP
jgi:hypothetical protein